VKGLYLEEIEIGVEDFLGRHRFTREAIVRFAKAYDPQPFHLSEEAARTSHFGALCASGWHTAAAWMRCYVAFNENCRAERRRKGEQLPAIGPSPGFENLKWLKPVYVDDTISFSCKTMDKRVLKSRAGWGLVCFGNTGMNQNGDIVFGFDGKVLVQMRGETSAS
jgi:acyl dehydratase